MNKEEFISLLNKRGLTLTERQSGQFDEYASFLAEYNEKVNLTAITEYEEVLEKHFYDSLLPFLDMELKGSFCDVGTGAGFPGVVLKVAYPDLEVTLIEPLKKRCVFLELLKERLGLEGMKILNVRGEDYALTHREVYDYVSARAVSGLNTLIEVCGALVKENGHFIALRGRDGQEEIKGAEKAFETMGFEKKRVWEERLPDGSLRVNGDYLKIRKTSKKYPRKYSIMKQKPL